MKNIFKVLLTFIFVLTGLNCFSHTPAAFDMDRQKYHCPKTPDAPYNFMNLYVPNDDCSSFRRFGEKAYDFCIRKNLEFKARFDAGECEKIIIYEHNIGGAKCRAEVLEKSQKHISTECSGKNTSRAIRSIKRLYGDDDDEDEEYDDD